MKEPVHIQTAENLEDLDQIAADFLKSFPDGGIFGIQGEMGAGKTTFVHAICKQFGLEFAGSPTFSLVNQYKTPAGLHMYHLDLYRLKNFEEALDIGIEEYLYQNGYVFIEWPGVIAELLPAHASKIHITEMKGQRKIAY